MGASITNYQPTNTVLTDNDKKKADEVTVKALQCRVDMKEGKMNAMKSLLKDAEKLEEKCENVKDAIKIDGIDDKLNVA